MLNNTVTFVGCGSWGAALGSVLENKGINVRFWHRNSKTVSNMQMTRKHYLMPKIEFGQKVSCHSDINEAIVISTSIDVRSAPIAKGENVLFIIHEGTKAQITASETGWYEILLLDGKKGWVNKQYMRKI